MSDRPAILAVEDDLEAVEAAIGGDPAEAVASARESLRRFDAREAASQLSALEDAENLLLRAQTGTDGRPARRIEAIRNRLRIYRESIARAGEDLAVIDTDLRTEDERDAPVETLYGESAELIATVVNADIDRRIVLLVEFYDDEGSLLEELTSEEVFVEGDEQAAIDLEVVVPDGTAYYAVLALDAESETIG